MWSGYPGSVTAARFQNLDPGHRPPGAAAILKWGVLDRITGRRLIAPPGPAAPRVDPDLDLACGEGRRPRLTWIGHASFLATLGGRHFLIDPVFASHAGVMYPRHGRPGLGLHELPPVSAVLVTHNHYDHLDANSIHAMPPAIPVVAPAGVARYFARRRRRQVVELGWWEEVEIDRLRITLVPARHWSRRGVLDTNRSLWGGFVVASGGAALYHAGDTAWFDGFAEIGQRFPELDAALLPVGGYAPGWFMERQHLNPEQAGSAFLELGAKTLVPMHWGAFQLTDEPLCEPADRAVAWWQREHPTDGRKLRVMAVGETVVLE